MKANTIMIYRMDLFASVSVIYNDNRYSIPTAAVVAEPGKDESIP